MNQLAEKTKIEKTEEIIKSNIESKFELFRIISMILIIIHHYSYH